MAKRSGVYWEASVFIAHFQAEKRDPVEMSGIAEVVRLHDAGDLILITSALTRVEVLEGRMTPAQRDKYRTFMLRPDVQEVNVTRRIVERAAQLRADHKLGGFDALHLATAIEYDAEEFHTFDGPKKHGLLKLASDPELKARIKIKKPSGEQLLLPLPAPRKVPHDDSDKP